MSSYSASTHTHNFACWTAAAAVRRGFTTNEVIASAIEKAKLHEWANQLLENFDNFSAEHDNICDRLVNELESVPNQKEEYYTKCTFGRAAKIVSIYLKTYIVLPYIYDSKYDLLLETIYPPIDQLLLTGIQEDREKLPSIVKKYKWTKASKDEYHILRNALIAADLPFNWKTEEFWKGYRSNKEE